MPAVLPRGCQAGYEVLNEVVVNQVLVSFGTPRLPGASSKRCRAEGTCWCGGTVWQGRTAMRISVSSWATTEADVEQSLAAMLRVAAKCGRDRPRASRESRRRRRIDALGAVAGIAVDGGRIRRSAGGDAGDQLHRAWQRRPHARQLRRLRHAQRRRVRRRPLQFHRGDGDRHGLAFSRLSLRLGPRRAGAAALAEAGAAPRRPAVLDILCGAFLQLAPGARREGRRQQCADRLGIAPSRCSSPIRAWRRSSGSSTSSSCS